MDYVAILEYSNIFLNQAASILQSSKIVLNSFKSWYGTVKDVL